MTVQFRLLAVSAASGRVGYVFFYGHDLSAWGISRRAFRSTENAAGAVQGWINEYKPNIVVTEKFGVTSRKGERSRQITRTLASTAAHNYLLDIALRREQRFRTKYEEAQALAAIYPALLPRVPKPRRLIDVEPRETVLFEALALAHKVLEGPTLALAAGMD